MTCARRGYVWVVGHGGSGTKRVYNLFDLHPSTHCHMVNESDPRSRFSALPGLVHAGPEDRRVLDDRWDDCVEAVRSRLSRLDHLPPHPKDYHWSWARRLGLWRIISSPRALRAASRVLPAFRGYDFELPRWLGSRERMRDAPLVLKTNKVAGWASWVVEHRPEARVTHVVRHPGGYLNAWIGRYFASADAERVTAENRRRLRGVVELAPEWGGVFGDIDSLSAEEAELFYWRFEAESIFRAGTGRPNYLLVTDDSVVEDPVGVARRLFTHAGLEVHPRVTAWIEAQAGSWRAHRASWRALLDASRTAIVERVLDGSLLAEWWEDDELVSDYKYVAYATQH